MQIPASSGSCRVLRGFGGMPANWNQVMLHNHLMSSHLPILPCNRASLTGCAWTTVGNASSSSPVSCVAPETFLRSTWRKFGPEKFRGHLLEIFGNSCWKYFETSYFHLHLKLINYTRSLRWPFPQNGNHLLPNNTLSSKKLFAKL